MKKMNIPPEKAGLTLLRLVMSIIIISSLNQISNSIPIIYPISLWIVWLLIIWSFQPLETGTHKNTILMRVFYSMFAIYIATTNVFNTTDHQITYFLTIMLLIVPALHTFMITDAKYNITKKGKA